MDTKQRIIREWEKVKVVHPTYRAIGKKLGLNHAYVYRIVKQYLKKVGSSVKE